MKINGRRWGIWFYLKHEGFGIKEAEKIHGMAWIFKGILFPVATAKYIWGRTYWKDSDGGKLYPEVRDGSILYGLIKIRDFLQGRKTL